MPWPLFTGVYLGVVGLDLWCLCLLVTVLNGFYSDWIVGFKEFLRRGWDFWWETLKSISLQFNFYFQISINFWKVIFHKIGHYLSWKMKIFNTKCYYKLTWFNSSWKFILFCDSSGGNFSMKTQSIYTNQSYIILLYSDKLGILPMYSTYWEEIILQMPSHVSHNIRMKILIFLLMLWWVMVIFMWCRIYITLN